MQLSIRQKKIVCGVTLFCTAGTAVACGCPAVADGVWMAGHQVAELGLKTAIAGMVQAINAQETLNTERIISALKVQTKQIALNGEKEAANASQSMQALATTVIAQDQAIQIQKVMEDFGNSTGQGYDPCGEQAKARYITAAYANSTDVVDEIRSTVDTAPGVYKDPVQTRAQRLSEHRALFCTPSEVSAGLCSTVGPKAGASLSFATMFQPSAVGDDTEKAKNAFVNNVFGLPDAPIDSRFANMPETQAYMRDKMKRDGMRSIAATSFKSIQSMSAADPASAASATNNNGFVAGTSFLDALSAKVDQYAGGADYRRWEQSQAVQSERGLLVNLAKMNALKLYMTSVEYDQYERMEANLAALLAVENSRRAAR